jgi:prepilin-type N-terminal cleavage/methylation domain-containing protein
MKKMQKGFILIELLVVVAIIGILASVVLASLNTARAKGADAAVKANLANMRAQAELFYDSNNNQYTNVCADANMSKAETSATTAGGNGGVCTDGAQAWAAWAGLKSDTTKAWCVDNTGTSKEIAKPAAPGTITVCP